MPDLKNLKDEEIPCVKMEIKEILKQAEYIDYKVVADEVLTWATNNVESFVDSEAKMFKLNLAIDNSNEDGFQELKKLQDLYRAIPDDDEAENIDECVECRMSLDKVSKKCYEEMEGNDLLKALFKRMIFFYEKLVPDKSKVERALEIDKELKEFVTKEMAEEDEKVKEELKAEIMKLIKEGESLVQYEELKGVIKVLKFEYEAFEVGVKIVAVQTEEEKEREEEKKVVKEYVIPEGFIFWLEIAYQSTQLPTSMF